jgi:hypothetical protein
VRQATWPPPVIVQKRLQLKNLEQMLKGFDATKVPNGSEIEAALVRHVVVQCAGHIESVRDTVADFYCKHQSSPRVARRIQKHLRSGQGVLPQQVDDFVRSFEPEWADELAAMLSDDPDGFGTTVADSLGKLVTARKKVAHGDGVAVQTKHALDWVKTALTVDSWLVARFNPH